MAGSRGPLRLDPQQLGGEIERGALGRGPRFLPAARADAAELRTRLGQPDVAGDEVRLRQRHVQRHALVEFQRDDLARAVGGFDLGQAAENGDAMLTIERGVRNSDVADSFFPS